MQERRPLEKSCILFLCFRFHSDARFTNCTDLLQDFVWAFGQILAGVVTISIPIRFGASKFRDEIVNQVYATLIVIQSHHGALPVNLSGYC